MNLAEYVDQGPGRQTAIAIAIGCQPQLVWQWSRGIRRVPAERCPAIEQATRGEVTCEDLRPDVQWSVLRDKKRKKGVVVSDFAALGTK